MKSMKLTLATPTDFSLFPHVPGEAFTLAMEVENEQVAFAHFYQNEDVICLVDLFVLPEHNGKGFGRSLLTGLSKTATYQTSGQLQWTASTFEAAVGTILPYTFDRANSGPMSA